MITGGGGVEGDGVTEGGWTSTVFGLLIAHSKSDCTFTRNCDRLAKCRANYIIIPGWVGCQDYQCKMNAFTSVRESDWNAWTGNHRDLVNHPLGVFV